MNIAWIAGFFDGEGCVMLPRTLTGMQVSITQNDRVPLDLIKMHYGFGNVTSKGGNGRCHKWVVCGKKNVLTFLRSIRQYCIVKRKDIEIGILYAKTVDTNLSGSRGLGAKKNAKLLAFDKVLDNRRRLHVSLNCGNRHKRTK